uniref:DNA polymerase lambda n=1 Tax=Myxine glutinosa TaxID=7769 RepID=UPI00358E5AAC
MAVRGFVKTFSTLKRPSSDGDMEMCKRLRREVSVQDTSLSGVHAYPVPTGLGTARRDLIARQLLRHGAHLAASSRELGLTHILVSEGMTRGRLDGLMAEHSNKAQIVYVAWLSECISLGQRIDTGPYLVSITQSPIGSTSTQTKKTKPLANDVMELGEEEARRVGGAGIEEAESSVSTISDPLCHQNYTLVINELAEQAGDLGDLHKKKKRTREWIGAIEGEEEEGSVEQDGRGHFERDEEENGMDDAVSPVDIAALLASTGRPIGTTSSTLEDADQLRSEITSSQVSTLSLAVRPTLNHNSQLTEKLEVLAKAYTQQGDRWRAHSYRKAINALKGYPTTITSIEEARSIAGIGNRLAEKIAEILASGHLRQAECLPDSIATLTLFTGIWGVGHNTAQAWYRQGLRSLEDVRNQATLTRQQEIGLQLYHDLQQRIPRAEVDRIEHTVQEAAVAVDPGIRVVACGSYRRGRDTCGDVDLLVTQTEEGGSIPHRALPLILARLRTEGFLTDDLASRVQNGMQTKYMGVCRLPRPGCVHRRLDALCVPHEHLACALLHFTGSARFNRALRLHARLHGHRLSEHTLRRTSATKDQPAGTVLTNSEQDIFHHLGLPYREPHERDW